jgi:hypothetical protein
VKGKVLSSGTSLRGISFSTGEPRGAVMPMSYRSLLAVAGLTLGGCAYGDAGFRYDQPYYAYATHYYGSYGYGYPGYDPGYYYDNPYYYYDDPYYYNDDRRGEEREEEDEPER